MVSSLPKLQIKISKTSPMKWPMYCGCCFALPTRLASTSRRHCKKTSKRKTPATATVTNPTQNSNNFKPENSFQTSDFKPQTSNLQTTAYICAHGKRYEQIPGDHFPLQRIRIHFSVERDL